MSILAIALLAAAAWPTRRQARTERRISAHRRAVATAYWQTR